ncbi:MAG: PotD/PotF family extracellular solute-binding protein [Bryobacteraceae bacterium]
MTSSCTRRSLITGALTAGCARRGQPALTVFTWAGPWGQTFERALKPLFEQATGANVVFDNGWGEDIPKLLAAPPDQPPYDVMIVAPYIAYAVIRRKYFQKLDWGKIPNARLFHPAVRRNWVFEENWGLTWPDALHTGIYNVSTAPRPVSWSEVLDRDPGLYRASYMSLYTFSAARYPGRAAEAIAQDFEGAFAFAREQRRKVSYWWPTSPDMAFNLLQGNVKTGNIHSVDAFGLLRNQSSLDVFLTEDRAHFQAIWLVPRGTRYRELAHEFINQFASSEFQREYAAAGFPTSVPALAREQARRDPLWARINPHAEADFDKLRYYPYDTYLRHWDDMTGRWNREILV